MNRYKYKYVNTIPPMKFTRYSVLEYEREHAPNTCLSMNVWYCQINFYKSATHYFNCFCYEKT